MINSLNKLSDYFIFFLIIIIIFLILMNEYNNYNIPEITVSSNEIPHSEEYSFQDSYVPNNLVDNYVLSDNINNNLVNNNTNSNSMNNIFKSMNNNMNAPTATINPNININPININTSLDTYVSPTKSILGNDSSEVLHSSVDSSVDLSMNNIVHVNNTFVPIHNVVKSSDDNTLNIYSTNPSNISSIEPVNKSVSSTPFTSSDKSNVFSVKPSIYSNDPSKANRIISPHSSESVYSSEPYVFSEEKIHSTFGINSGEHSFVPVHSGEHSFVPVHSDEHSFVPVHSDEHSFVPVHSSTPVKHIANDLHKPTLVNLPDPSIGNIVGSLNPTVELNNCNLSSEKMIYKVNGDNNVIHTPNNIVENVIPFNYNKHINDNNFQYFDKEPLFTDF